MNIPHTIHYCWLGGGKMNHILSQCVKTFPKLGDNKIVCWDESNSQIYDNDLLKFQVEEKNWGFVSDYVRFKALYDHGGIYLDTDIQVVKPLPEEFYDADLVVGYAFDDILCTAFIMAKPHHPFIKYLLDLLMSFLAEKRTEVSNGYVTQAFLDYFPDFKLDGKYREFAKGCYIYPRHYFDSASFKRDGGYCIHHGMGCWHTPKSALKRALRPTVKLLRYYVKPFGVWYQNRANRKMVASSGRFLEIYRKNMKE